MDKHFIQSLDTPILELLPHGAIQQIAEETDMYVQSVTKILKGEWNNEKVVRKAKEIIEQRKKLMEQTLAQFPTEGEISPESTLELV